MQYEQRVPLEPVEYPDGLWSPGTSAGDERPGGDGDPRVEELAPFADITIDPADRYVAIDERVGTTFGLTVSRWPGTDRAGRPVFPDEVETVWFDNEDLQPALNRRREANRQTARPPRIGDAFWVRDFQPDDCNSWGDAVDITLWARDAAKVALFGTVAGVVDASEMEALGLVPKAEASTAGDDDPPPEGPVVTAAI